MVYMYDYVEPFTSELTDFIDILHIVIQRSESVPLIFTHTTISSWYVAFSRIANQECLYFRMDGGKEIGSSLLWFPSDRERPVCRTAGVRTEIR